eukprot:2671132-Rhodomonas_salina.1
MTRPSASSFHAVREKVPAGVSWKLHSASPSSRENAGRFSVTADPTCVNGRSVRNCTVRLVSRSAYKEEKKRADWLMTYSEGALGKVFARIARDGSFSCSPPSGSRMPRPSGTMTRIGVYGSTSTANWKRTASPSCAHVPESKMPSGELGTLKACSGAWNPGRIKLML